VHLLEATNSFHPRTGIYIMRITLFDESCFIITLDSGIQIVTDPYYHSYQPDDPPPDMTMRPPVSERADIVTISHGHFNNSYIHAVKGVFQLYTGGAPAEIKGVALRGVASRHLYNHGENAVICMTAEGIRIVHMGDFGQEKLTKAQLADIGAVDILMTPWLDWTPAVLDRLSPKVVLPMKGARVDDTMKQFPGFTDASDRTSELPFSASDLPSGMRVILLQPAVKNIAHV
jgi:L-ascorbate metabolism protein UlaG (beta-lactamase superfamily)